MWLAATASGGTIGAAARGLCTTLNVRTGLKVGSRLYVWTRIRLLGADGSKRRRDGGF